MAKASDNPYPSILTVPGAAPAAPAAGQQRLFLDSADGDRLKRVDSSGTVVPVEAGDASDIPFTPSGSLAGADVQAAIEELDSEKVAAAGTVTKIDGPITQAAYDALTPAADTLYVIVG